MKLSTEENYKNIGTTILVSCLKYSIVKIFWATTTIAESIA